MFEYSEPKMGTGEIERLLTTGDLSEYVGIPVTTLYHWRMRGEGPPAIRVGKHLRFRRADVEQWLDAQRESGGDGA
jgi:excisionase family DNA binding protein